MARRIRSWPLVRRWQFSEWGHFRLAELRMFGQSATSAIVGRLLEWLGACRWRGNGLGCWWVCREGWSAGECRSTATPGGTSMPDLVRPTAVACLPAGRVDYRLDRRGEAVVVVFHGGHVRAGLALGEEVFAAAGCTLLAPSRPGYGRTPLSTGSSVEGYTDVVRALCADLGITRVAAVVGVSGGGPTAATMAARHADLVERLILVSAVGWLPFPDRRTRLGAHVMFAAGTEAVTWAGIHALARMAPDVCLRLMMSSLSTRPVGEVVAALRAEDRDLLLALFAQMRSGRGFLNDLRPTPDVTARIDQPTLVIATRTDGGVPFAHAQSLASTIRNAQLVESRAHTHFVWLGPDWPAIAERIRLFLDTDPIAIVGPARSGA